MSTPIPFAKILETERGQILVRVGSHHSGNFFEVTFYHVMLINNESTVCRGVKTFQRTNDAYDFFESLTDDQIIELVEHARNQMLVQKPANDAEVH